MYWDDPCYKTKLLKKMNLGVEDRIKELEKLGVKVVPNVNATQLETTMAPYFINNGKAGDRWHDREL